MPYTLLLADDSVTIQRVIELTFADEDVTVVAVSDGDQAIERLEASPIDIVLADIGMPGKNGYEVAQYMRRSPKLAHIPVMLLTGAFEPVDQARANEAGCDGVLAKPFEPQLVIGRVKELLARARRPESQGADLNLTGGGDGEFSLPSLAPRDTASPDSIWAPPLAEPRAVSPFADPPIAESATGPAPRAELDDYFDRLDAAFSSLSSNAPVPPASPAGPIAVSPPPALTTEIDWFSTAAGEVPSKEPWDLPTPAAEIAPTDRPLTHASEPTEAAFDLLELERTLAPAAAAEPAFGELVIAPDERLAPIEEAAPVEEPAPIEAPAALAPEAPPAEEAAAPTWAAPVPQAPVLPSAPALELPLPNPPPLPALADAFAALLAAEQGGALTDATGTWPAAPPPAAPPAAVVTDELLEDVTRRVLARLSDTVVREAVADIASKVAERLVREEIERIKASIK